MSPTAAVAAVALVSGVPHSAESRHKEVARTEIEKFESAGDASLAAQLFTPGYQLHFPGYPAMDVKGHQNVLGMFRAAFPDLKITLLGQVAEGDKVANHFAMRGTHRGDFNGIPATGKSIVITGTNLMRFEGEKIADLWGQLDMVGLMQQLGVVPSEGSTLPTTDPEVVSKGTPGAKEAVRRFTQGFNAKDVAALCREYSESYVLDFPGGPSGQGVAGIRAATEAFIAAFPDLRFTIDDLIEEGDRVVWRWTMTGTHRGPLGPVPASGKAVTLTGISLFKVAGGKIVQDKVRADMLGLLGQMGAIPPKQ